MTTKLAISVFNDEKPRSRHKYLDILGSVLAEDSEYAMVAIKKLVDGGMRYGWLPAGPDNCFQELGLRSVFTRLCTHVFNLSLGSR